jgi:hypothetical protein
LNPRKKLADKTKLKHLALVEPKTVGNSDLRDRERNGAGCKPQQRILRKALNGVLGFGGPICVLQRASWGDVGAKRRLPLSIRDKRVTVLWIDVETKPK